MIFTYKVEDVYWFFGILFACYLSIPVFSLLIDSRKILWYIVGLNFIFVSILPVISIYTGLVISLNIPIAGGMLIYVLLGYLLSTKKLKKGTRVCCYILGVICTAFRYFYTYAKSMEEQCTNVTIKGYNTFHAVFLAVMVFVFIQNIVWDDLLSERMKKFISQMSSYSFGIYLIHKVVMYYEIKVIDLDVTSLLWRVACIPLTYVIAFVFTYLIKKVPYLNKIIG